MVGILAALVVSYCEHGWHIGRSCCELLRAWLAYGRSVGRVCVCVLCVWLCVWLCMRHYRVELLDAMSVDVYSACSGVAAICKVVTGYVCLGLQKVIVEQSVFLCLGSNRVIA